MFSVRRFPRSLMKLLLIWPWLSKAMRTKWWLANYRWSGDLVLLVIFLAAAYYSAAAPASATIACRPVCWCDSVWCGGVPYEAAPLATVSTSAGRVFSPVRESPGLYAAWLSSCVVLSFSIHCHRLRSACTFLTTCIVAERGRLEDEGTLSP